MGALLVTHRLARRAAVYYPPGGSVIPVVSRRSSVVVTPESSCYLAYRVVKDRTARRIHSMRWWAKK